MLWEGIRVYSRSQYESLSPRYRFILTEEVRNSLHPDIPDRYLDKSLILITAKKKTEIEVEGINFIIVDDDVEDYTLMSLRDAERRYPDEMTECRLTGSSVISKLFQDDQIQLLTKRSGAKRSLSPKKTSRRKSDVAEKAADSDMPPAPVTVSPCSDRDDSDGIAMPSVKKRAAVRSDGVIRPLWKPRSRSRPHSGSASSEPLPGARTSSSS